ncbi:hypothetical protein BDY17DRAFT_247985 [Neohortaea acidophila]|uniref:NOT2/NOT3/NOT5 C-terminal domain-containing protein n=1 Tax=Neohortaea acidophila TaxID=245834 RepID=A0A6A6PY14_9PEZI|nr:uncharacterized protein BDY17DRAFT_247985 [Neohortaea acidophila]KAF2484905.1 hypothetical protein BDY17DRAFT_247985 [Neohortaea acidophila]
MGHDLTSLGLDLDSPEPLYPTFTPFQAVGSSGSSLDFHDRHIIPDFTLPSAYTVTNVPPLTSRMGTFNDETLFTIFYQHPRDVLQELAAHELINRDWRWHKVLHQWLQKDTRDSPTTASPLMLRGVYIFFDAMNWRRERRLLELDYESLDPPRVVGGAGGAGPSALGLGSAQQLQIGGGGQQSGGGVSGGGSSQILPS